MEVIDVDKELKNIRRKFNRNKGNAVLMKKYIGQLENLIARTDANIEARKDEVAALRAKLEASQAQLDQAQTKGSFRHSYTLEQFEKSFFKRAGIHAWICPRYRNMAYGPGPGRHINLNRYSNHAANGLTVGLEGNSWKITSWITDG